MRKRKQEERKVAENYDFDVEMQLRILAMCTQHAAFLPKYRRCLDPGYFRDPDARRAAQAILTHYDEYNMPPDRGVLYQRLQATNHKDAGNHVALCDAIYLEVEDTPYVAELIVRFAKQHGFQDAVIRSLPLVEAGEYDEAQQLVLESLNVGLDLTDQGYDYRKSMKHRIFRPDTYEKRVPTGMFSLDKALGGGLSAGELGVIMGVPGGGKSTLLMNFAAAVVQTNGSVFVSTHEMSAHKWSQRMDVRLTGNATEDTKKNPGNTYQELDDFFARYDSNIILKQFPAGEATWRDILQCYEFWTKHGMSFKAIFVDYLDILRCHVNESLYRLRLKYIAEGLRALGTIVNVPVWTAVQLNRSSFKKDTAGMGETSESHHINAAADVIITINQTEAETRENEARLFLAKNRDGVSKVTIPVRITPSRHHIGE